MEQALKELTLSRIMAGCLRFRIYTETEKQITLCFKKPTIEQVYVSQELYQEYLKELQDAGCWSEDDAIEYMIYEDLWSEKEDKDLIQLAKNIEEFKVKLYESGFKSDEKEVIKDALIASKDEQERLLRKKQGYFYTTTTGGASMLRSRFLIAMSTYKIDNTPFYNERSFWKADPFIFEQIAEKYFSSRLLDATYREIARTEPWRSIWNSRKAESQLFGLPAVELNEEQKNLIIWSNVYDSIYEHPECPSDEDIDDDDVLDGWMIVQRRKRKSETDKSAAEQLVKNETIRNCGEVFIPVNTIEDAKKLSNALNDDHAKAIKKKRMSYLRQKGEVHEAAMPDSAMEIQQQLNAHFLNKGK